jgi:hypothetical protein
MAADGEGIRASSKTVVEAPMASKLSRSLLIDLRPILLKTLLQTVDYDQF